MNAEIDGASEEPRNCAGGFEGSAHNGRPTTPEGSSPAPVPWQSLHQQLLERFAAASILVAPDNRLVNLSEQAQSYLVLPGDLSSSVVGLVREELRIELAILLQASRNTNRFRDSGPIPVRLDGRTVPVVMHVRPAQEPGPQGFVLVIFEEHQPPASLRARSRTSLRQTDRLKSHPGCS